MLSITCRPKTFSEVVGQDLAVKTLKSIAKSPGVSVRSIVLQGSYGCGKTTCAKIFGRAVNCESFQKTGEVCLVCDSCKTADSPTSQTYLEFDASRVGNVDAIKALVDRLHYTISDSRRVVVIDECHAASTAALTALLKVLEEGIPNTFFVFSTTEPLMKTIMSRSCVIPFSTIEFSVLNDYVRKVAESEQIQITPLQIELLVSKSAGHARNAMQLLDHFRMVGEDAINTSYATLSKFFLAVLKREDTESLLKDLEKFPLSDVSNSLSLFLKNSFMSVGGFESKLKEKGITSKLFMYFYQPEIREALKDEFGMVLAFRNFESSLRCK